MQCAGCMCMNYMYNFKRLVATPPPRELRMSSDQQADIKLAQTIKDQFMSRVRVATQVSTSVTEHCICGV